MDHDEMLDRGINNIVSDHNFVTVYIGKYELWETLTKPEQDFLNEVSKAAKKLADTNKLRGDESNGKLG